MNDKWQSAEVLMIFSHPFGTENYDCKTNTSFCLAFCL